MSPLKVLIYLDFCKFSVLEMHLIFAGFLHDSFSLCFSFFLSHCRANIWSLIGCDFTDTYILWKST